MTTHVEPDAPGVRFLGFLGIAASAERHSLPGERVDLALNWSEVRFFTRFLVGGWVVLSIILLVPPVGRLLARPGSDVGVRWEAFLAVTGLALLGVMTVLRRNLRAASLEFTTAGVWVPSAAGGYFLPWQAIHRVKLINNAVIQLDHDGGRLRIYALAFADPYALSKLIRAEVPEAAAGSLPTESYD